MNREASDYKLIDSGNGMRLERFGPYVLLRPAPMAFWSPRLPESKWENADAVYHRSDSGGGDWEFKNELPERWPVSLAGITFLVKPTGFGHIGVFPEQMKNWDFLAERIAAADHGMSVMNLFGYTGAATLIAARSGAEVCHLDASKGVVQWARDNARENGLEDRPVRWIVEDALKFLKREFKRGRRYHGLIIDPPTYGRGNKGEVWKIERDLPELLKRCREVMDEAADFAILSTYSPKFTPAVLTNLLEEAFGDLGGQVEMNEMSIPETDASRLMPNGATARWAAGRK